MGSLYHVIPCTETLLPCTGAKPENFAKTCIAHLRTTKPKKLLLPASTTHPKWCETLLEGKLVPGPAKITTQAALVPKLCHLPIFIVTIFLGSNFKGNLGGCDCRCTDTTPDREQAPGNQKSKIAPAWARTHAASLQALQDALTTRPLPHDTSKSIYCTHTHILSHPSDSDTTRRPSARPRGFETGRPHPGRTRIRPPSRVRPGPSTHSS
jgi:hypothetical protein